MMQYVRALANKHCSHSPITSRSPLAQIPRLFPHLANRAFNKVVMNHSLLIIWAQTGQTETFRDLRWNYFGTTEQLYKYLSYPGRGQEGKTSNWLPDLFWKQRRAFVRYQRRTRKASHNGPGPKRKDQNTKQLLRKWSKCKCLEARACGMGLIPRKPGLLCKLGRDNQQWKQQWPLQHHNGSSVCVYSFQLQGSTQPLSSWRSSKATVQKQHKKPRFSRLALISLCT